MLLIVACSTWPLDSFYWPNRIHSLSQCYVCDDTFNMQRWIWRFCKLYLLLSPPLFRVLMQEHTCSWFTHRLGLCCECWRKWWRTLRCCYTGAPGACICTLYITWLAVFEKIRLKGLVTRCFGNTVLCRECSVNYGPILCECVPVIFVCALSHNVKYCYFWYELPQVRRMVNVIVSIIRLQFYRLFPYWYIFKFLRSEGSC